MRRYIFLAFAFGMLATAGAALAVDREALVIGEQRYAPDAGGALTHPVQDANLISSSLRENGFNVGTVLNGSREDILAAVDDFAARLGRGGKGSVGFFYYSGHGVANDETGRNYLIPISVSSTMSSKLWYESVELEELVGTLQRRAPQADLVVVFDACRSSLRLPNKGGSKSLTRIDVGGMLIAYSTSPGTTAWDGNPGDPTGPYAAALARQLNKGAPDAVTLFENVKYDLQENLPADLNQLPWTSNGLKHKITLTTRGAAVPVAVTPSITADAKAVEMSYWQSVHGSGDQQQLRSYLSRYPNGFYVDLAEAEIDALNRRPKTVATAAQTVRSGRAVIGVAPYSEAEALNEWTQSIQFATKSQTIVEFLRRYPEGAHVAAAQQRLEDLQSEGK